MSVGPIAQQLQKTDPGALVSLFSIDLTPQGGTVLYFSPGVNQLRQSIVFDGITYPAVPITWEGYEKTARGTLPRPKVRIANVNRSITALLIEYDDLIGCTVTHKVTLAEYLDAVNFPDGVNPDADPLQFIGPEIYRVERKVSQNRLAVELELSASIDQEDRKLPARQILRTACPWIYRRPDGAGAFIYHNGQRACPYSGAPCFDENDQPTDAAHDNCSGTLTGCRCRYPGNQVLPFGGFPGAGLTRA